MSLRTRINASRPTIGVGIPVASKRFTDEASNVETVSFVCTEQYYTSCVDDVIAESDDFTLQTFNSGYMLVRDEDVKWTASGDEDVKR